MSNNHETTRAILIARAPLTLVRMACSETLAFLKAVTCDSFRAVAEMQAINARREIDSSAEENENLKNDLNIVESRIPHLVESECAQRLAKNEKSMREADRTVAIIALERDELKKRLKEVETEAEALRRTSVRKIREVELKAVQDKFIYQHKG